MTTMLLLVFWAMQVTANLCFKFGSTTPSRWALGFILGNVVGMSSIWFMMKLYARMNPNLAMALAGGGAFLCIQLALSLLFHSRLTQLQWIGMVTVTVGMMLASSGGVETDH
ncbi:MAG TPA: hypothetical protein VGL77_18895 [Armatimonadota bacterium]|jgi:multidrug transporter EmrE-like cation transporter